MLNKIAPENAPYIHTVCLFREILVFWSQSFCTVGRYIIVYPAIQATQILTAVYFFWISQVLMIWYVGSSLLLELNDHHVKPAHVKSSLFGCSLNIPISDGKLALG